MSDPASTSTPAFDTSDIALQNEKLIQKMGDLQQTVKIGFDNFGKNQMEPVRGLLDSLIGATGEHIKSTEAFASGVRSHIDHLGTNVENVGKAARDAAKRSNVGMWSALAAALVALGVGILVLIMFVRSPSGSDINKVKDSADKATLAAAQAKDAADKATLAADKASTSATDVNKNVMALVTVANALSGKTDQLTLAADKATLAADKAKRAANKATAAATKMIGKDELTQALADLELNVNLTDERERSVGVGNSQ